jgi:hypothetical protein
VIFEPSSVQLLVTMGALGSTLARCSATGLETVWVVTVLEQPTTSAMAAHSAAQRRDSLVAQILAVIPTRPTDARFMDS